MYRINRERLAQADMPFVTTLETRFDDLDPQGHLNNIAIGVLLQEARIRYAQACIGPGLNLDYGIIVGSIIIDYARELFHPDPVEIGSVVLEIGRSSFVLGNVARQRGQAVTFAEVGLIFTDGKSPVALPDNARAELERGRIDRQQPAA